jgi:3-deoxy-D-manno-octulosonate 8-phosphate phosphatase (KDO 8-P phosphatase)
MGIIEEKVAKIRLLLLDVDGVMTDGRITMNERGEEIKSFDVKDGQGLKMLMSGGVEVVLVTGRRSRVVEQRAHDLGIGEAYQGISDKKALCRQLMAGKGLKKEEICCIGDDLPDLAMFSVAGLCIAVADAVKEVREAADFTTRSNGGSGAVREVCEWILKGQGKWHHAMTALTGE